MRRVLVTGANGSIGRELVKRLSEITEIEIVYAVDIAEMQGISNPKIVFVESDLSNLASLERLPKDVDSIFMLAAMNGTQRFYTNPFTVFQNSILPTLNVLEHYKRLPDKKFVYTSSSEVYSSTVENFSGLVPTSENILPSIGDPRNPRWSYASAKLGGEVSVFGAAVEFGISASIIRYHNVFGPGITSNHFVPDFIGRARKGEFWIRGADETRAFLYLDDAIEATIKAMQVASVDVPLLHIGTREELSIRSAAQIILEEMGLGSKTLIEKVGLVGSVKRRCADPSLAQKLMGWEAKTDFRSGIRKLLK